MKKTKPEEAASKPADEKPAAEKSPEAPKEYKTREFCAAHHVFHEFGPESACSTWFRSTRTSH